MAYFLEALIFCPTDVDAVDLPASSMRIVPLSTQLSLLPLTDEVKASGGGSASKHEAASGLPPKLESWARRRSKHGSVGYIVAEYFGGQGDQFAIIWTDGEIVFGPLRQHDAINQALRRLGVKAEPGKDEFDTIRLGRHRHTEQWI